MSANANSAATRQDGAAPEPQTQFVGRQPIFDADRKVVAYELLFRSDNLNIARVSNANQATYRTMDNSLNFFGLNELVGSKLAFFNFPRDLILDKTYDVLPSGRTVIELLEDVEVDQALIEACRTIRAAGYAIALDDFAFSPQYEPLLKIADFVKLDVLATDLPACHAIIKKYRRPGLTFLAEKVETHAVFHDMKEIGCDLFQGYFFCTPEVLSTKPLGGVKQNYLLFMKELARTPLSYEELEQTIKRDMSLSVKLLKYLNSAAVGLTQKISSIHQAITLLGEQKLKRWGALVGMACMAQDKPLELARICLIRGRFCELMADDIGEKNGVDLFLLGLLSGLDAILDRPMAEALKDLPLSPQIKSILLGDSSRTGKLFMAALACERGDIKRIALMGKILGLSEGRLAESHREAITWADQTMDALAE